MSSQERLRLFLVVPVCVVLAIYFAAEAFDLDKPPPDNETPGLDPVWYSVETARGEIRNNQTIVGNCFICHAFWVPIPTSLTTSQPRFAHSNITINHGSNDRCYNCHHITDRNMYTADDGSTIMVQTPEKLCARCHGLIYNDWQKGTHGKWTGKFKPGNFNERTTYTCTECHDPHDPLFRYNTIAPAPVWPEKYIRNSSHGLNENVLSGFLLEEKPKEIF